MMIKRALSGRMQHLSMIAVVVIVFFVGFTLGSEQSVGAAQGNRVLAPEAQEAFSPLFEAYNMIERDYIDDVPLDVLVDGALTGMFEALGDEYSGYMDPEVYAMLNSDLEGEFNGIGVVIRTREDTNEIEVVSLLNGAPAQAAGVLPGDVFAEVDGVNTLDMDQSELAARVRGLEGTAVNITMRRGEELIEFEIVRARITVPNVEAELLEGDVAYITLNQFSSSARADLTAAFDELDVNNRAGLIVDFRNNPGGLLTAAVDVGSLFIESGPIVIEEFGDGRERIFEATGDYADIRVPMVLLVNAGSASASELVAGAIQDLGVATIIGETTLGKGTVQTWSPLSNGGGIRLTIARWLTPNRRWIHEAGVTPDIFIEWTPASFDDPDLQLQAALDFLLTPEAEAAAVVAP